jgi:hypothetical protein
MERKQFPKAVYIPTFSTTSKLSASKNMLTAQEIKTETSKFTLVVTSEVVFSLRMISV